MTSGSDPANAASEAAREHGDDYAPEREIRLAVVMYGGVSLAIYMYGVAQEFLNLVKATAPATPGSSEPGGLAFPATGTVAVYRKLAGLLGSPGDADGKVRVRFVIDLVSGSSAGGLNGVCLATALANDRPGRDTLLEPLEELWVRHGDLETLFAGPDSERDDAGQTDPDLRMPGAPPSLLNGLRFYKLLARTLHDQLADEPGVAALQSRLVDQLDLWVTATDLDGRRVTIPIANTVVSERQHAYRFHFVYDPVAQRNDFTRDAAPFVAFAGRSTSSFPVAFEPMRLEKIVHYPIGADWHARFYPESPAQDFARISFSDGGILDNKPFSYATQDLVRRPASLPVDRYLVYVEPDPGGHLDETATTGREWNAADTAIAALTGIPRSETIRGDLELVRRRNRAIRRARSLLSRSGLTALEQQRNARVAPRLERDRWLSMGFAEMVAAESEYGPTYPVYHRLKVNAVCDYLAGLLAAALDLDPDGEDAPKLRAVVDAWKRPRYQEEPSPSATGDVQPRTEPEFLFRFDMPFRIRRLGYVLSRLRDLASDDEGQVAEYFRAAGVTTVPAFDTAEVAAIRRELSPGFNRLVELQQRLAGVGGALRDELGRLGVDAESIVAMEGDDEDALRSGAPPALIAEGSPLDSVVHDAIRDATDQARTAVEAALGERHTDREVDAVQAAGVTDLRRAVRFHYDAFESFDLVYLPLSYETAIADTNPVTIIRVSPLDATKPEGVSRHLRGIPLYHFAAFTDATWRQHDIAWGRLNASEILIRNLLPGDPRAEALIDEAHELIAQQYAATASPVAGRAAAAVDGEGQPILAAVPVTKDPHWDGSVRRAAGIASVTAQDQLRRRGKETAAQAVGVATKAAGRSGSLELVADLLRLVPAKVRTAVWVAVGTALLVAALSALLAVPADGLWEDVLVALAALLVGALVGIALLVLGTVVIARSWLRRTIDAALVRR